MTDRLLQFVGYFSIFLIVYGTISNLLALLVCIRKRLRQTALFVFLSFKVICDTVPLYTYSLNPYFLLTFGYNIGDINIYLCRFLTFFTNASIESSVWLMVILFLRNFKLSTGVFVFLTLAYFEHKIVSFL